MSTSDSSGSAVGGANPAKKLDPVNFTDFLKSIYPMDDKQKWHAFILNWWQIGNHFKYNDPVSAPPHYTRLEPQPIDVIEAWNLGFYAAQVLKYIARAGFKEPSKIVEDLKKARYYLDRWIKKVGG